LEPRELGPAFRFVFHNTLARSVFTENAELSQVTGVTQELIRDQFAVADKEAIRLYSDRVAALIDQCRVPYENQSGPVRTWTELALLGRIPLSLLASAHAPWHFLYFLPEPHGQRSFRPTFGTLASMLGLPMNGRSTASFPMSRAWFCNSA